MLLAIFGIVAGVWFYERLPVAAGFVAGMCFGAIFRDIGWLRRSYQTWPVTEEIVNWIRVEELIEAQNGKSGN